MNRNCTKCGRPIYGMSCSNCGPVDNRFQPKESYGWSNNPSPRPAPNQTESNSPIPIYTGSASPALALTMLGCAFTPLILISLFLVIGTNPWLMSSLASIWKYASIFVCISAVLVIIYRKISAEHRKRIKNEVKEYLNSAFRHPYLHPRAFKIPVIIISGLVYLTLLQSTSSSIALILMTTSIFFPLAFALALILKFL